MGPLNNIPATFALHRNQQVTPAAPERAVMDAERDRVFAEYEEVERDSKPLADDNCTVAKSEQNVDKNRWRNILPFDDNRVTSEQDEAFYINASMIELSAGNHKYIATQGPLENTTADFWRMVWENNIDTIVMLCKLREAGRVKCHKYWPTSAKPELKANDHFEVVLVGKEKRNDYTVREFTLSNLKTGEGPRHVTQFHYKTWPDFGVPKDPKSLIAMRQEIRERQSIPGTPHVVHCSAGVGRTGTWCAIDAGLDMKDNVNVKHIVKEMRQQRVGMVQTPEQFGFVHRALNSHQDQDTKEDDQSEDDCSP